MDPVQAYNGKVTGIVIPETAKNDQMIRPMFPRHVPRTLTTLGLINANNRQPRVYTHPAAKARQEKVVNF